MQKIIPHLWFDRNAKEATEFYVSAFTNSKIMSMRTLHNTPSGDCDVIYFNLSGCSFMAISAGPYFKINPSISFMVNFDQSRDKNAQEHLDELWNRLSGDGKILMPLQEYPFSKHYGWVEDKYGVSWQLITNSDKEERPFIVPSLMFTGNDAGKAEEATNFYLSLFKDSKRGTIAYYSADTEYDKEGTVMFTDYQIAGQWFAAMDSAYKHSFFFNEAVSLIVLCETQDEINYYWQQLSAVPESEQCGWVKDKYGVSWQIVPRKMNEMMRHGSEEQIDRLTQAFLPMKKMDIATLEKAFKG